MRKTRLGSIFIQKIDVLVVVVLIAGAGGFVLYRHAKPAPITVKNGQDCGFIYLNGENGSQYFLHKDDYNTLTNCFMSSFMSHQAAYITFYQMGVDNGPTKDTYATSGSTLQRQSDKTYRCKNVAMQLDGVLFTCNGGNILYSIDDSPEVNNNNI